MLPLTSRTGRPPADFKFIIVQDFFQLLQDNVMIWRAEKKSAGDMEYVDHHHRVYTAGHFEEEFRLNPSQVKHYFQVSVLKCMIHDPSLMKMASSHQELHTALQLTSYK